MTFRTVKQYDVDENDIQHPVFIVVDNYGDDWGKFYTEIEARNEAARLNTECAL